MGCAWTIAIEVWILPQKSPSRPQCSKLLLLASRSTLQFLPLLPSGESTHIWLCFISLHHHPSGALQIWHNPFDSTTVPSLHVHSTVPTSEPLHLLFLSASKPLFCSPVLNHSFFWQSPVPNSFLFQEFPKIFIATSLSRVLWGSHEWTPRAWQIVRV